MCVYGPRRVDRRTWDKLAAKFESSVYDIVATDTRGVLSDLVDRVRPRRTRDTLVDLGCGIGTFVKEYGARFAQVVALDFSPVMIERARERLADMKNVEWIVSDIPRAAESLASRGDLVVCLNVITSTSAAKRAAIWDAVREVTRPGGHALLVLPALESAQLIASVDEHMSIRDERLVETDEGAQKYYVHDELDPTARRHGLVPEAIEKVHYPWSEELASPRSGTRKPFDWAVLARRDPSAN